VYIYIYIYEHALYRGVNLSYIQGVFKKRLYCSFYSILSTVPCKVVPSTGDTPFPNFLPLLECFLEHNSCDGTQFSYRIFLNLLYSLETTSFQSGFKFKTKFNADTLFKYANVTNETTHICT